MELTLSEITITPELWTRSSEPPDVAAETAAIRRLADTMAADPSKTLQTCVELALELCHADTCGISLYERTDAGEEVFRWIALAGVLKDHLHGTTPRHFSPCGICVDNSQPLLMRRPELFYKYLDVGPPFHDALLIPLTEKGSELEGTIWVVAHNTARKFDCENTRMMQRLAVFTATVLQMARVAEQARETADEKDLLFRELEHRIKNTLQMTAALLRLQLGGVSDPTARDAIETASQRMLAMGQVHRIDSHGANHDVAEVVRRVCADLKGIADPHLRVQIETEPVTVPSHKAAVAALIVNELLTNAIKYAFRDCSAGTITVTLRRTSGDEAALSVADDGMPLPPSAVTGLQDGLGLRLVRRLASQLGGRLELDPTPKRFTVSFPTIAHQ